MRLILKVTHYCRSLYHSLLKGANSNGELVSPDSMWTVSQSTAVVRGPYANCKMPSWANEWRTAVPRYIAVELLVGNHGASLIGSLHCAHMCL